MSDMWEKDPNQQPETPVEPQTPADPPISADPQITVENIEEKVPETPPMNGFASDGSYRYVPPRTTPPTPPQNSYYPPQEGSYPPPVTPRPPQKKKNGWMVAIAILTAIALVIFGIGGAFAWMQWQDDEGTTQTDNDTKNPTDKDEDSAVNNDAPQLNIQEDDNASLEVDDGEEYYYSDGGLTTEEIVSRNYDCTVVLTIYSRTNSFYFGESNLAEVGAASGIVMTADGYIITNRHCVVDENTGENYDRVDVTTYDGTVYENAEVIGADEATDLAVIKVDAKDLTPAEFGSSDDLAVGARVVALGNAAGLSWTATQGIVSAKARDVYEDTGYAIKCLQVDVAINSGNSGGPLLNKFGQVVGINSVKIAASGYEGLGFSIPINEAKVVIDSLLKYGFVKGRVSLGIRGQTVSSGMYKGFMIVEFVEGSCFEGTDAQIYDLIVAVDNRTVEDYGSLRSVLAKYKVGDKVKLKLLRSNQRTGEVTTHYVSVTLKEQTAE